MTPEEIAALRYRAMQELIRWERPGSDGERAHYWLQAFLRVTDSQASPPKLGIGGVDAKSACTHERTVRRVRARVLVRACVDCGREWL